MKMGEAFTVKESVLGIGNHCSQAKDGNDKSSFIRFHNFYLANLLYSWNDSPTHHAIASFHNHPERNRVQDK